MSAEIEIELPALPDYVSFVRLVVAAVAELEPSLETSKIDDLRVAVSEAATNAIQAHARAGSKRPISVRCRREDGQVEVVLRDEGAGFDVDTVPEIPAPDSPERLRYESGMGISMMRALADESHIHSGPHGTEVCLVLKAS